MIQNPPLFFPLPTPDEMSRWDSRATSLYSIPSLMLMENAAQASFDVLARSCALGPDTKVLVFAGKGNNGGDGVALARILHDEGYVVRVVVTTSPDELPSPAWEHAAMALALGVPFVFPDADDSLPDFVDPADPAFSPHVVVDALTGTGIQGNLRERELELVRRINSFKGKAFILSLDIPSGLSGLSGKAMPEAVRADATVCFEAGKPGLYMPGAAEYTGELYVRRVGIPLELRKRLPASWRLLSPRPGAWALPSPCSHKGSAGKVLIVGGSEGMAGAPLLAALGALRCGSGLVHAALPGGLEPAVRAGWPEVLAMPVGNDTRWRETDLPVILDMTARLRPGCLVLGPGMGRDAGVAELVRGILAMPERPPVLLDADALYFLDTQGNAGPGAKTSGRVPLSLLRPADILTPHPGEMARMLPDSFFSEMAGEDGNSGGGENRIALLQEHRAEALASFTAACPAVLVLKGAGTLVGKQEAPVTLSPFSVAALGVGGSGDVLAGVCASLVALGMDSLDAACLGVHLHGRAGELLGSHAARGHLAREIAERIPEAWQELCGC